MPAGGDVGRGAPAARWARRRTGRLRLLRRRVLSSLSLRLAVMLSLALVPLGLIAISQTSHLLDRYERVNELNLQVGTEALAREEGMAIETALGAAEALAATYLTFAAPDDICSAALRRLQARLGDRIDFIGLVPPDGMMTCSTSGMAHDFSDRPQFEERMQRRELFVTANDRSAISGGRVISVHSPILANDGAFRGFVTVSVATEDLIGDQPGTPAERLLDYVLLSPAGAFLDASRDIGEVERILPAERGPEVLTDPPGDTFVARTSTGAERRFSVAEVVPGRVFLIGSTPVPRPSPIDQLLPPDIYPVLMWLISLALVFAVVEGSLVGPVRAMADRMRRFGETRELRTQAPVTVPVARPAGAPSDVSDTRPSMVPGAAALPLELRRIDRAFAETAQRLLLEEAELADTIHDKEVLLKEVHHRVKNNLQMVSSILNMQMREANDPAVEAALGKVAGRISSLAAVHRQVYAADRTGAVRADTLLREIVLPLSQTLMSHRPAEDRPEVRLDLAPIGLTPDQAMPAAMFVVEALPYLLREARPDAEGNRWVLVRAAGSPAVWEGDRPEVWLSVRRSGRQQDEPQEPDMTGLGARLIKGFARQLQGDVHTGWAEGGHGLGLRFRAMPFSEAPPAGAGADGAGRD